MRLNRRALLPLAMAIALLWWLAFRFGVEWGKAIGHVLFGG